MDVRRLMEHVDFANPVNWVAVCGFALALIETLSAKLRIFRAPEFLGTAFLLAVLAMLVNLLLGS